MGLQLRSVYAGRMAPLTLEVRADAAVHSAFVPVGQIVLSHRRVIPLWRKRTG
jgi:hypothetical protein